jgi:hypothetical protein
LFRPEDRILTKDNVKKRIKKKGSRKGKKREEKSISDQRKYKNKKGGGKWSIRYVNYGEEGDGMK